MSQLTAVLIISAALIGQADEHGTTKRVIQWGWDEPDTKFMRQNIAHMERFPFDGLVFHVVSRQGGNLAWHAWGQRKFELSEFQQALDDLKATEFRRLTDRFLRVNVTPGNLDWFNETAWSVVLHNFDVAAQIAKEGGCKGFMFDVEQYESPLFDYGKQTWRDTKSFMDYQLQVRQCGRQWMETVHRRFPEITILLTFGYQIAQPPSGKDRSEAHYGLLADLLDGMLEGCGEQTTIVDAWEYSYPYKERTQFAQAYETIKQKSAARSSVPDKYARHVQAGFGIWMDYRWRELGWNLADFSRNHFTPDQFEASVRAARQVSDRYVWIYAEQPRWWTNERLPIEYIQALERACQQNGSPNDR